MKTEKTKGLRARVAEKVASTLRQAIVSGKLRPGDALPSERELAGRYDVNRSSIREAMKQLEAWGLVKIRQGGATRVSELFLETGGELLPKLLTLGAKADPGILRDLHEVRALLLGWCAEQAALKADPASIERLEQLTVQLEGERTPRALQELDYQFFEQLLAISGNRLLALLGSVVRSVYLGAPGRFESLYKPKVFDPKHHRAALEAIRARNPAAAGAAMKQHALTGLLTLDEAAGRPKVA